MEIKEFWQLHKGSGGGEESIRDAFFVVYRPKIEQGDDA